MRKARPAALPVAMLTTLSAGSFANARERSERDSRCLNES
jgi:hypothetical protein